MNRAAAADKLAKRVAAIEAALPDYLTQSRMLADALSEIGHWHFVSGQIAGYCQNTMGQVEVAANIALAELKAMPDAIREDRQAIPQDLSPAPVSMAEPPPTMTVLIEFDWKSCVRRPLGSPRLMPANAREEKAAHCELSRPGVRSLSRPLPATQLLQGKRR
jgi:hypothetical protein